MGKSPYKRGFILREAVYPDAETAAELGGVYHSGGFGRPAVENRLWMKCDAEGLALLAFVQADPALGPELQRVMTQVCTRKERQARLASPPEVTRAYHAIQNRRAYFTELGNLALREYMDYEPLPAPAFRETPRYVLVAFKRHCVRLAYKIHFGNDDFLSA